MPEDDKPNPLEDVRKGLGLLFRAAKTTVEKLPTKDLEEAVVTSAREFGRAIENVGKTIEREVFGGKASAATPPADGKAAPGAPAPDGSKPADEPPPGEPRPPGPRVG